MRLSGEKSRYDYLYICMMEIMHCALVPRRHSRTHVDRHFPLIAHVDSNWKVICYRVAHQGKSNGMRLELLTFDHTFMRSLLQLYHLFKVAFGS